MGLKVVSGMLGDIWAEPMESLDADGDDGALGSGIGVDVAGWYGGGSNVGAVEVFRCWHRSGGTQSSPSKDPDPPVSLG